MFDIDSRRWCGGKFMLDTNAINAKQKIHSINRLESWRRDGVIQLLLSDVARGEAMQGRSELRHGKASQFVSTNSGRFMPEHFALHEEIERAIFPVGAKDDNQRRDVDIVEQAAHWSHILITNDGESRSQPLGILGARKRLAELGARVMRPEEAYALAIHRIKRRNLNIEVLCNYHGVPEPAWLYSDLTAEEKARDDVPD